MSRDFGRSVVRSETSGAILHYVGPRKGAQSPWLPSCPPIASVPHQGKSPHASHDGKAAFIGTKASVTPLSAMISVAVALDDLTFSLALAKVTAFRRHRSRSARYGGAGRQTGAGGSPAAGSPPALEATDPQPWDWSKTTSTMRFSLGREDPAGCPARRRHHRRYCDSGLTALGR